MNIHICANKKAFYAKICTILHGEQLKRIIHKSWNDVLSHICGYPCLVIRVCLHRLEYWYSQIREYADVETLHTRGKYDSSTHVLARMN
jgi:hypothetical protein